MFNNNNMLLGEQLLLNKYLNLKKNNFLIDNNCQE